MTGNDFVVFLLRSPLHGLFSKNTLVVTLTGRKTGRTISFPVGYLRVGTTLWTITTRSRTWWKNVRTATPVRLRLQGQDVPAIAEAVEAEDLVARQLQDYLGRVPQSAKWFNIRKEGSGAFNVDDLARTVRERMFVKFQLKSS